MTVIAAALGAGLAAACISFRRAGRRWLVVACLLVMAVGVVVTAFSRIDDAGQVSSYGVFAFVIVYFALDYRGYKARTEAEAAAAAPDEAAQDEATPDEEPAALPEGDATPEDDAPQR